MSESPLYSRKGGNIHRLRSRVHDFEPFLDMTGEWQDPHHDHLIDAKTGERV